MFYDDAFRQITENSAFTETAVLTVDTTEYELKGFFYSGNYGEKKLDNDGIAFRFDSEDKGYTAYKTVKRQSFQVSKDSLPVEVQDLARQILTVRNVDYTIREVTGNDSGMIVMELVPKGGAA